MPNELRDAVASEFVTLAMNEMHQIHGGADVMRLSREQVAGVFTIMFVAGWNAKDKISQMEDF